MKGKRTLTGGLLAVLLLALAVAPGQAQGPGPQDDLSTQAALGTGFTYQGRLTDGGSPADGTYDFQFRLHDDASADSPVGSVVERADEDVSDGLFTVELDFGDVFDGTALWLEVAVRPGSSNDAYAPLAPRQALTAAPYSLYAVNVGPHDHWGEFWSGTGTGLTLSGGTVGLSALGSARGVYGYASDATSGTIGVYGIASATDGNIYGVYGVSNSSIGDGVFGRATASSGPAHGVTGYSLSTSGTGVRGYGRATSGEPIGIYGYSGSPSGYAGFFAGDVRITGDLTAAGAKSFKIDHPLDPANRYLYHFTQEAPEVQNVYNGMVTLDATGEALVTLPAYFAALNADPFRYQLTPIGASMPDLYIAEEIQEDKFKIAGGISGQKVSWEVTAVRRDPYLRDHPAQTEQDKRADEQGTYLYPQGYGQPQEMSRDHQRHPDLFERAPEPLSEGFPPGSGE